MGQRGTAASTGLWYLIASHGDMVACVRPGMLLGETASGELSFDRSCAQLELDIADDGGLVLRAAGEHELESADGKRCRRQHLQPHRRAEIRLAHHVLQLDTDFAGQAPPDATLKIRALRSVEDVAKPRIEPLMEPAPGPSQGGGAAAAHSPSRSGAAADDAPRGDANRDDLEPKRPPGRPMPQPSADALPARAEAGIPERMQGSPPGGPAERGNEPASQTKAHTPRPTPTPTPTPVPAPAEPEWRLAEPPRRPPWQLLAPALAVLIGLAGLGFLLLNPGSREGSVREPSVTIGAVPAPETETEAEAAIAPAQPPSITVERGPGAQAGGSQPLPSPPHPAEDMASATGPDQAEALAAQPAEQLPLTEPGAAPTIEPVVLPPVKRRSLPQVVRAAEAGGSDDSHGPPAGKPDPAVVAELEAVGARASAMAEELTLQRDLHAAHLALLQGRLIAPPQTSAYTLYSRVLARDPRSAAAGAGLQSVRQGLINRALAQLAGGELDGARKTLENAADAGANPLLIADLRDEVDHRQRMTDAGAGRFDSLYPADKLVAVSQEPPRVSRRATSGSEVAVDVQFTVTASGDVSDVAVQGDPPEKIARAVRRAVGKWRFEPVLDNGRPTPVRSSVRFTFGN